MNSEPTSKALPLLLLPRSMLPRMCSFLQASIYISISLSNSIAYTLFLSSSNDVDAKYGVRGFPTLKFFPANNKETPLDYEGDRSLEDMTRFIQENAR